MKLLCVLIFLVGWSVQAQDTLHIGGLYIIAEVNEYVANADSNHEVVVVYPNQYISNLTQSFEDGKSVQIHHLNRDSVTTLHYYKNGELQDKTIQFKGEEHHWGWYEKNGALKDSIVRKPGKMYWIDYNLKGKMNFILIDDSLNPNHFYSQYYDADHQMITSHYKDSITTRVWNMDQELLMVRLQNGEGTVITALKTYDKKRRLIHDLSNIEGSKDELPAEEKGQKKWLKKNPALHYLFEPDNAEGVEFEFEIED